VQTRKLAVTSIETASIAEDGSTVTLELGGEGGGRVGLAFTVEALEGFAGQLTQMVALAQNKRQQSSGQVGIRATEIVAVSALAPSNAGKVILQLRSPSGLTYGFALSPDLAELLRPELLRAAYGARQHAS